MSTSRVYEIIARTDRVMKNTITIAAEGIKREVPSSFGLFVSREQARKIIDALEVEMAKRDANHGHMWVAIHLTGDPCIFDGNPIAWKRD